MKANYQIGTLLGFTLRHTIFSSGSETAYKDPTYYEDELATLKKSEVRVHAFYVKDPAKICFESIASSTGGRCEKLDIESSAGAEVLTGIVTEEVLRNTGGAVAGDRLVAAYRSKFAGKGYHASEAKAASDVGGTGSATTIYDATRSAATETSPGASAGAGAS